MELIFCGKEDARAVFEDGGEETDSRGSASGRTGDHPCGWKKNVACIGKYFQQRRQICDAGNADLCGSESQRSGRGKEDRLVFHEKHVGESAEYQCG